VPWSQRLAAKARRTPLEPIFFPQLRVHFADCPDLHCSINESLFTSETGCGYGYDRAQKRICSLGFSRAVEDAPDTESRFRALPARAPHLRANRYRGCHGRRGEKITLPGALASVSKFSYVAVKDLHPGSGILAGFPFDRRREQSHNFETELPYLLGSTDPCSTAVTMEPFSTSVFKAPT